MLSDDPWSLALGTALILLPNLIIGYVAFKARLEQ
jgi:hypothetical protein